MSGSGHARGQQATIWSLCGYMALPQRNARARGNLLVLQCVYMETSYARLDFQLLRAFLQMHSRNRRSCHDSVDGVVPNLKGIQWAWFLGHQR